MPKISKKRIHKRSKVKKEFPDKEFRVWIEDAFAHVKSKMLLEHVKLNYVPLSRPHQSEEGDTIFSVNHSVRYHRATIYVYPQAHELWKAQEYAELIGCVCHELSHLHTTNIADIARRRFVNHDEVEEGVEKLTDTIGAYVARSLTGDDGLKKLIKDRNKK